MLKKLTTHLLLIAALFIAPTVYAESSIQELHILAEQGDVKAQHKLGGNYFLGLGVPQDYAEAAKWIRKAAEQGDALAQSNLGVLYTQNGQGVVQDYAEALKWLNKAARRGNANGQFNLGRQYEIGHGVAQDDHEAAKWYRRAARRGDAFAQFRLGVMYAEGRGVTQDDCKAFIWLRKSAEQGNTEAQSTLVEMSPDICSKRLEYRTAGRTVKGNTGKVFESSKIKSSVSGMK